MVTNEQTSQDIDQLRLLSIFHYIVAGLIGLFSLFPIIHLILGIALVTGSLDDFNQGNQPPDFFGWLFIILPLFFILSGLGLSIFVAIVGRRLATHTCYTFCLVVAAIECMFMPVGTILGVFTIYCSDATEREETVWRKPIANTFRRTFCSQPLMRNLREKAY